MNFSIVIGLLMAAGIIYKGAIAHVPNPMIFLDEHAIMLVVGGTLAAAFVAFPIKKIFGLVTVFFTKVLLNRMAKVEDVVKEFVEAAQVAKVNPTGLSARKTPHPFMSEGYQLIAEGVLSDHELKEVLSQRAAYFKKDYGSDARIWLALSKFPPAFGLLGASTGMIAMMANLESQKNNVGSAMAVALVATFWGIAFANLVLLPLSDYYQKLTADDANLRFVICEGLMMLKRKESPLVVVEKLNSHLPLAKRLSSGGGNSGAKAA